MSVLDDADQSPVGAVGRITVPVPPDGPGEVMVPVRGGTEAYAAWSDRPLARHTEVLVVEQTSPRSVVVVPFPSG
ncbi:hypothetical protein GCM10009665_55480 [Kitasatospora nipponensis]|uniref:Uncharacterized protein n=1 Tax=Kitasatospora nipponensis TaxID=258049 RepID=A0ABP4HC25_9ACTN